MAKISIETDSTISGTKLIVDGKEVTKDNEVVRISLWAHAPYISPYDKSKIEGNVSVNYDVWNEDKKTIESCSYNSSSASYVHGIGNEKKKEGEGSGEYKDNVNAVKLQTIDPMKPTIIKDKDQVVRFIGKPVDQTIETVVNKIIDHCDKNKVVHASKEVLLSRTIESLVDKANDIGLKLED